MNDFTNLPEHDEAPNRDMFYIPLDKQSQNSLLGQEIIRRSSSHNDTGQTEVEWVASDPLPWEYEENRQEPQKGSIRPTISSDEQIKQSVNILLPLFEDIVVSGLISVRWSRGNGNMSTYFKCYHLYDPNLKNGTLLADLMQRSRMNPQRYSKRFNRKKCSYRLDFRILAYAETLEAELLHRSKKQGIRDAALSLFHDLKSFLNAAVEAASWDSCDSFDLCAEVYKGHTGNSDFKKAVRLLENEGCRSDQIAAVQEMITHYKRKEKKQ